MAKKLEEISKRDANELFEKDIKNKFRAVILCAGISGSSLICAVSPCGRDAFMTGAVFVLSGIAAYYNYRKGMSRTENYNRDSQKYIEEHHEKIIK